MKNKTSYKSAGLLFAIFAFILLLPIGCTKEDDAQDDNTNPTIPVADPEVNDYLINDLPDWKSFCPNEPDEIFEDTPIQEFNCEDQVVLSTTPCSITRTPEEIVTYDPGSEILYLGSLIQGEGYIGGLGSIKSLPIYQRAPITLSISFQIANNSKTVENPNLASVNAAIGELIDEAQSAGHVSGSSIFFNKQTSHSVKQTALSLGLSYKFMKGGVESSLSFENTSEKTTVSAYFKQKMFTVSMVLPQVPGDIFSADFTQEKLNEQISLGRIGPDNLPVFVSNIVFGRIMVLTMTSTYEANEMKAALEGSYNGIGGSVSAEHLQILEDSEIQLVTIGGDASLALGYLRSGNLGDFFESDAPLTTAVPISYTLRNLGDNEIATVSETTAYDMVQYEPVSVATYASEGDWKNAVESTMSYQKWECNWTNVLKADESNSFDGPGYGGQWALGKRITFNSVSTGYPFSFYLENMDGAIPPDDMYALVWNDHDSGQTPFTDLISIGDMNDWDNDDFEIRITSGNVYALAFDMKSNTPGDGEFLQVFAEDANNTECEIEYYTDNITGFFGVISPVPIKRIWFDEAEWNDDDIALGDLFFGYRTD